MLMGDLPNWFFILTYEVLKGIMDVKVICTNENHCLAAPDWYQSARAIVLKIITNKKVAMAIGSFFGTMK